MKFPTDVKAQVLHGDIFFCSNGSGELQHSLQCP